MKFKLKSKYKPAGDQPQAIKKLVTGLEKGQKHQTLLGVTGSGKTFTMANVIKEVQRPTLVIAHNKTLAAQLCNEFREFFPDNVVEYFVSYYDYYQPEAYLPRTDTYIEKEAEINEEIDRLRHSATQALLSRKDVIIVASVSCIYGLGAPETYEKVILRLIKGEEYPRNEMVQKLVDLQFERTNVDLKRGQFRVRGEVVEVMPMNEEIVYRIVIENDVIKELFLLDHVTRRIKEKAENVWIFPAKHFITMTDERRRALGSIRKELYDRLAQLEKEGKVLEAERLSRRTRYDLEMLENLGYCNGIENYSRHLSDRGPGDPPETLLSYFPDDFLTIIDESHVTVPQVRAMYNGDQSRKSTLVDHGFRLPSAKDNRPLNFEEFEERQNQVLYTSATPGDYEFDMSDQVVEQIIRPTGLVDPKIIIRPVTETDKNPGQIDDLIKEVGKRVKKNERVLVTTLTKKMSEDLSEYLKEQGVKVQYLHSGITTLERVTILSEFRKGAFDVLVGVNLLREGLDLPEVTLVAILDADKEGFLRSETSLIQTIGRAARNVNGQVILYADKTTGSIDMAVKETERRRKKQTAYNKKHNITPKTISKTINDIRPLFKATEEDIRDILDIELKAEPHELKKVIKEKEEEMKEAAKSLQFELAAILRDEIKVLEEELENKK